jgi:hypothetical protein
MNKIIQSNTLLISNLLHSRTQSHIFHFRTHSYSQHKALELYYTSIVTLLDSYTEAFQGNYGLLTNYKSYPFSEDTSTKNIINYYKNLILVIEKTIVPDDYLKNILQSIHELISKTIYLITNLK